MQLERECRADDLFLVDGRDVAVLHPLLPILHRLAQESIAHRLERFFDGCSPCEHELFALREREGVPVEKRERRVGSETELGFIAMIGDVVRTLVTVGART